MNLSESDILRFENKIDTSNDCHIWKSSINNKGYGEFSLGKGNNQLAHRVSYQIYIGDIPKGLCVLHRCDNPPCVNPNHLFIGTKKDNSIDMVNKNRHGGEKASKTMIDRGHNRGQKQWKCKLTQKDIIEIRRLAKTGLSHEKISKNYPVNRRQISRIINKKSWKHLN